MRRIAKVPTAGSTTRQATGLGRIFRGAFAVRGASIDAKGSGAPLTRQLLLAAVAIVAGFAWTAPQADAGQVAGVWAAGVTETEALLRAEINPNGAATTYRVEYGFTDAYGSQTPEAEVGDDGVFHTVSRFLSGLVPGATYHYRFVATNADEVNASPDRTFATYAPFSPDGECPNQALRHGPAANLPDCRAYEMVSPIDKNGGDIETAEQEAGQGSHLGSSYRQASVEGGKVTFSSAVAFGDAIGGHWSNQYIATRGATGWSTHGISSRRGRNLFEPSFAATSPLRWFVYGYFQGFTPDLSSAWVRDDNVVALAPGALDGYVNLYRRDNLADAYEPITVGEPAGEARPSLSVDGNANSGGIRVLGASEDLRHQVFVASGALTPDAPAANSTQARTSRVYDLVDGELHLVSVLPSGVAPTTAGAFAGTAATSNHLRTQEQMTTNVVSNDGSRVFWTLSSSGPGQIYMRENPGEPQTASGECDEPGKACTMPVSGSVSAAASQFWAASADGSRVLFSQGSHPDRALYLFDVETQTPTQLAGNVQGVAATAEDLSHIYFVSTEDKDGAGPATAGDYNLYDYSEGSYSLVGALADEDDLFSRRQADTPGLLSAAALGVTTTGIVSRYLNQTRATPDGRRLVFMSRSAALAAQVAGYDNTDVVTGLPDFEVYRYDAVSAELSCVSCKPSGARPRGHLLRTPYNPLGLELTDFPNLRVAASIPSWEHDNYASRVVSADGGRVFFHSDDALLPRDTNGVQDLYQWRAEGTGGCEAGATAYSARNDGCIDLISTGRDGAKSEFVDATPDGAEVYFSTDESLDPRDPGLRDIYVAKVGGGFPLPEETAPCEGEACQSPPPPPEAPQPSSETFTGPGDPTRAGPSCQALARRAKRFANRAKRQRAVVSRGRASRANRAKTRKMRRSVRRNARRAAALSKRAKRCRRANRRANTSRRAGR